MPVPYYNCKQTSWHRMGRVTIFSPPMILSLGEYSC